MNWDERFLKLVDIVASWSDEPDTKTGAIIVDAFNNIVSWGWNKMPRGSTVKSERQSKPDKYIWYEHAERNAIYTATKLGRSTNGCIMYMRWFPCAPCARAIIQAGITTLICNKPTISSRGKADDKYNFKEAQTMLEEAGVEMRYYEEEKS